MKLCNRCENVLVTKQSISTYMCDCCYYKQQKKNKKHDEEANCFKTYKMNSMSSMQHN